MKMSPFYVEGDITPRYPPRELHGLGHEATNNTLPFIITAKTLSLTKPYFNLFSLRIFSRRSSGDSVE